MNRQSLKIHTKAILFSLLGPFTPKNLATATWKNLVTTLDLDPT
jgi:hypothetical protein